MKGGIGPMLHLGQWMIDVEVDKGSRPSDFAEATADKPVAAPSRYRITAHLGLPHNCLIDMIPASDPRDCAPRKAIARPFLDHALERCARLRRFRRRRRNRAHSACGALQDLLAAGFRFRLPTRLFRARCSRPDPGFFSHGA